MKIDREELLEMMNEYWTLNNNDECIQKTLEFAEKYNIKPNELWQVSEYTKSQKGEEKCQ